MHQDPLSTDEFVPGLVPPPGRNEAALWFLFMGNDLLIRSGREGEIVPVLAARPAELELLPVRTQFLGMLGEMPCFSGELPEDAPPPAGMEFSGLRPLHGRLPDRLFWLAARAVQIVDWDRTHQFCGRCGAPTEARAEERSRACPKCGLVCFPRLAPAVIISIVRGKEILLAHSHRLPAGLYSVIAGFVEPGETLEEAAVREIQEEVGVRVSNLRYFASQPWPFPHSLMIAFTAQYAGGDIRVDDREIEDAQWFRFDRLPPLPGALSVARRLIDHFLANAAARSK